jgi:hypothetical protein
LISEGKAVLVSEPRQVLSLIAQHGEGSVTFQAAPQDYRNAVNLRDPALYMPNFSRQAALDERGQAYSNQLTHPRSQQLAAEIKGGVQR